MMHIKPQSSLEKKYVPWKISTVCQGYSTSLRIFHVFKDYQEKGFIYQLVSRISRGQTIVLEGESGKSITPTSINMIAHSIVDLIKYKGTLPNVINICGNLRVSMRELSIKIAEVCNYKLSGFEVIGEDEFLVGDNRLLKGLLRTETIEKYFDTPISLDGLYVVPLRWWGQQNLFRR